MTNAPSGPQPAGLQPPPTATPARKIHMIGNAHLDCVWLWPWQEGYQEARATFRSVLDRMDEYPDFVFTCDQIVLLSFVEDHDPDLFARIADRVREGRWVNVGGWWVEPDCNTPSGESFVRQGLLGQRYLASRFGKPTTVGMNVDPFGHNAMIPQILRDQGMDTYTFLRPGPHESDLHDSGFWWESPDGSRVLAWRIPFEYCSPPGSVVGQTEKSLAQINHRAGVDAEPVMVFYGVGNHGGGPTKANIDSIHRFDTMGSFGRLKLSDPRQFFDEFAQALGPDGLAALPVRRDDLQHHAPGCYSAHSGIKQWLRRAQANVLNAERWAAVVSREYGIDYPREELLHAWEQVCFNQFHDTLPGSAVEPSYDDARDQLGEAVAIAKRIITRSHNVIARHVSIPMDTATQPVLVFNPHPFPVEVDIELQYGVQPAGVHVVDADGLRTPSQRIQSTATTDDKGRGAVAFRASLPALGYRLYRLIGGAASPALPWSPPATGGPAVTPAPVTAEVTDERVLLENQHLRVELDPVTGWLTSLLDKRTGVDVVAGAVGEHIQISEDPTDTWGHRVISYAGAGAPMSTTRVLVRQQGELRASVRVERTWGRSTVVEEFTLAFDADALDCAITIDWREHAHLMKLRFPTVLTDPVGTYEIPFGHQERPVDGAEEPGQSWIDLTGTVGGRTAGLTVINNAKHGYDVSPADSPTPGLTPSLGITAVRSPVYSWHDPRELEPDGLYSYQDQGIQRWRYQLVPHTGSLDADNATRRATVLGSTPRAMLESFHDGVMPGIHSYLDVETEGPGRVIVTALKGAEDVGRDGQTDVIVRAVESSGRPGTTSARFVLSFSDGNREVVADFGPSKLRTFKVPADPAEPVVEVNLIEWDLDRQPAPVGQPLVTPHEAPTATADDVAAATELAPADEDVQA
ncbi:alpha-mannosidase [Xylanimonas protaetiae]|uniref:Alpha-mannosidase n=1 Tax=Xylanimonas protaetiae TaxID=2509457 RepID=A0A4P6F840_9MICO|nr:alpha-mannosidase [Xylanimonas protaetiae]QAY71656.1 alpha-mannosidase [Xylanimonas protaetiae]